MRLRFKRNSRVPTHVNGPASSCNTIKSDWVAPSPPPSPPSPPPPPPLTPIPDASWHAFVAECLAESGAEVTGECTEWASGYNYGTMPNWDTSLVEDMSGYDVVKSVFQGFSQKSTFNGDISRWNTEKVTTMYYMFHSASAFNQDIGDWNTEKVTTMSWMFRAASAFNEDIGSWNTAQVTDMRSMFNAASAFNQDIGSWNTEKVNSMQWMFKEASSFNHDIGSWNTEKVTDMQSYVFFRFCVRPRHFFVDWNGSDNGAN